MICYNRFVGSLGCHSFGMWHHVTGWLLPDILTELGSINFKDHLVKVLCTKEKTRLWGLSMAKGAASLFTASCRLRKDFLKNTVKNYKESKIIKIKDMQPLVGQYIHSLEYLQLLGSNEDAMKSLKQKQKKTKNLDRCPKYIVDWGISS